MRPWRRTPDENDYYANERHLEYQKRFHSLRSAEYPLSLPKTLLTFEKKRKNKDGGFSNEIWLTIIEEVHAP